MPSSITLRRITKDIKDDTATLRFHFLDSEKNVEDCLFFTFPISAETALVTDRADAFLLALYPICARRNADICSDIPATSELNQKLNALSAFLAYRSNVYHRIHISAPSIEPEKNDKDWYLASGSLGVDSLHTLFLLENHPLYRRPTHLVFNNTGSNEEGGKLHLDLMRGRIEHTKQFCRENAYGFLFVDSNYKKLFGVRYVYTQLFINTAIPYMMGKRVSTFYSSSSGDVSDTLIFDEALGHIDFVLYPYLTSDALKFVFVEGDIISRYDKIQDLKDYLPAQRHLNVCFNYVDNCCVCEKCRRTLMALECLQCTDSFSSCFSPKVYQDNKDHIWADLILDYWEKDDYVTQMWDHFKKKLTFRHYMLASYKRFYKQLRHIRGMVFLTDLLGLKSW